MANKITRFRAYQLGGKGSSFSYCVDNIFTLIEARYNEVNKSRIQNEMHICNCRSINKLHITSWDKDHCNPQELRAILQELNPSFVDYPGYVPDSEAGKESLALIKAYMSHKRFASSYCYTPSNINKLSKAELGKYSDVVFNPIELSNTHNDNSIVKLFRKGRFTVLSLGDCESSEIAERISNSLIACRETDVMILAHHGADNGFTTKDFLKKIKPKIAICSSNYDNQYAHPDESIRQMLYEEDIPLFTTKTGDVIVVCDMNNKCIVYNLISSNQTISTKKYFRPKMIVPEY